MMYQYKIYTKPFDDEFNSGIVATLKKLSFGIQSNILLIPMDIDSIFPLNVYKP